MKWNHSARHEVKNSKHENKDQAIMTILSENVDENFFKGFEK